MASLLTKLKPKRRWMQVSLRTVLVLVTLLCVALGIWVVPAERQRRAVAAIERLGGNVEYVKPAASETFPVTYLRRWLPPDYVYKVNVVILAYTNITDDELIHLKGLTGLKLLSLNPEITDAGLLHLQGLRSLQILVLSYTQVTDAGLVNLQSLTSLEALALADTQVTDDGLVSVNRLTGLQSLTLNGTKVTDAGLAHLQRLADLQYLHLADTQITDAGLAHLHGLTSLKYLGLDHTQVTEEGVAQLSKVLPNCRITGP